MLREPRGAPKGRPPGRGARAAGNAKCSALLKIRAGPVLCLRGASEPPRGRPLQAVDRPVEGSRGQVHGTLSRFEFRVTGEGPGQVRAKSVSQRVRSFSIRRWTSSVAIASSRRWPNAGIKWLATRSRWRARSGRRTSRRRASTSTRESRYDPRTTAGLVVATVAVGKPRTICSCKFEMVENAAAAGRTTA